MVAFSSLYALLNPIGRATLACDDISKLSSQVLRAFAPEVSILEDVNADFDFVVILDTNTPLQLGPSLEKYVTEPSKVLVIDHHEPNPNLSDFASYSIIDSEASSTCEMLVSMFNDLGLTIDPAIANLLLSGMLFDTRRFFYTGPSTLRKAVSLVAANADYDKCLEALITKQDRSERIARLKASSRLELHTIDKWLVVTTRIGAYEASACRGLIDLGADVAIVGGKPSKNVVRISARSTNEFSHATGINLGTDVMEPLGELINGRGGGHSNAAGANGTRNRKEALAQSVELIREALDAKRGSSTESGG
jgi:phosphoesterase RecJ-like protein